MNGHKAKALRKGVYQDMAQHKERKYNRIGLGGPIVCVDLHRRTFQEAKRRFLAGEIDA